MKLFISGVTGYIGDMLMQKALDKGFDVHALARIIPPVNHKNLHFFQGDITNLHDVERALDGCEAVFHTAGFTRLWDKNRRQFYQVNVEGTRNILEAAKRHKIKRVVFTSSGAVLGPSNSEPVKEDDPRITPFENDYEISKFCAEQLVLEYVKEGLDAVIVSPTRVYGPGKLTAANPITSFISKLMKWKAGFIPSAKQIRGNYAFIEDVVEGHFLALEKGIRGEKYSLGGENIGYDTFFSTIKKETGGALVLMPLPKIGFMLAGYASNLFANLCGRRTHFSGKVVKRLYDDRAVSCKKAIDVLGYEVTPFKQGIRKTIAYLKNIDHDTVICTDNRSQ